VMLVVVPGLGLAVMLGLVLGLVAVLGLAVVLRLGLGRVMVLSECPVHLSFVGSVVFLMLSLFSSSPGRDRHP